MRNLPARSAEPHCIASRPRSCTTTFPLACPPPTRGAGASSCRIRRAVAREAAPDVSESSWRRGPEADQDGAADGLEPAADRGALQPAAGPAHAGQQQQVQTSLDSHLQQRQQRGAGQHRGARREELRVERQHEHGDLRVGELDRRTFGKGSPPRGPPTSRSSGTGELVGVGCLALPPHPPQRLTAQEDQHYGAGDPQHGIGHLRGRDQRRQPGSRQHGPQKQPYLQAQHRGHRRARSPHRCSAHNKQHGRPGGAPDQHHREQEGRRGARQFHLSMVAGVANAVLPSRHQLSQSAPRHRDGPPGRANGTTTRACSRWCRSRAPPCRWGVAFRDGVLFRGVRMTCRLVTDVVSAR